jgi:glutathione synthase/RimK-type ligase-like ATP-grasp enzyme
VKVALVTARAARGLDDDEPPLRLALQSAGCDAQTVEWDDLRVDWSLFDVALLRSAWDYAERRAEFLAWVQRATGFTRVLNPLQVVRWNTDKHYLAELARGGVAIVPSLFIEPGDDPAAKLEQFLQQHAAAELVIKPAVGAGSRDARRHRRDEIAGAEAHARRLLQDERSVLVQPYLERVDRDGETALMYFAGRFSHAVRKGALLPAGGSATTGLFAPETITPRIPGADEMTLAQTIMTALPFPTLLYARIDLIRAADGSPLLLELELTEPSLFFAHSAGSAARFTEALLHWLTPESR